MYIYQDVSPLLSPSQNAQNFLPVVLKTLEDDICNGKYSYQSNIIIVHDKFMFGNNLIGYKVYKVTLCEVSKE